MSTIQLNPLLDVFFWAVVATATMFLEIVVFISRRRKKRIVYVFSGIFAITMFEFPRFLIALLPQPAISSNQYTQYIRYFGYFVFILGAVIMAISFYQIICAKRSGWKLRTTGMYGIVRHPMYLGDILWAMGWSIAMNALYALALTPLWLYLRFGLAVLEEEKLEEKYPEYKEYKLKVKHRIIPGIL